MAEKRIWALLDERQGNTSQTLGVAEALGLPFEVKQMEFTPWIRLPNLLINHTTLGLTPKARALLAPPWPDVTIGTARRLGIVASCIKHQNPATFIAQIQWPGTPNRQFDLIAAPQHDGAKPAANLMETLGAPHRVTAETLAREADIWRARLAPLSAPRIAVLIGGSTRSGNFGLIHARELGQLASALALKLGGSLMLTTSRRTGEGVELALAPALSAPHYLHLWSQEPGRHQNPFYGYLGLADAIIVTGDSISMCSEACATGKPVFIYARPEFTTTKHRAFIRSLVEQGYARLLEDAQHGLFAPIAALNETAAIAEAVRQRAQL